MTSLPSDTEFWAAKVRILEVFPEAAPVYADAARAVAGRKCRACGLRAWRARIEARLRALAADGRELHELQPWLGGRAGTRSRAFIPAKAVSGLPGALQECREWLGRAVVCLGTGQDGTEEAARCLGRAAGALETPCPALARELRAVRREINGEAPCRDSLMAYFAVLDDMEAAEGHNAQYNAS